MKNCAALLFTILAAAWTISLSGGDAGTGNTNMNTEWKLPAPDKQGGVPLMEAVSARKTTRDFKPDTLSEQTLSDLLYAACGISHDGKLTIPTALNRQDVIVYVLLKEKAWKYIPSSHSLKVAANADLRRFATTRPGMGEAGYVSFVIVCDKSKWNGSASGAKYMPMHAGAVMQQLYLVCASKKLATVVCGSFDGPSLTKGLNLPENEQIQLVQIVGSPVR